MNTLHKIMVLSVFVQLPIFGMDKQNESWKDTLWKGFNWGLKIGCGANLLDGQKQLKQPSATPTQAPNETHITPQPMPSTSDILYRRHIRSERPTTKFSPQEEQEIKKRIESQLFNLIEKNDKQ